MNTTLKNHLSGYAPIDGSRHHGWFMGHFMPEQDTFHHSTHLELKWGNHQAGQKRKEWAPGDKTHSITILISGAFRLIFEDKTYELNKQGDYVQWKPFTPHSWEAIKDSTLLTIRWPAT